MNKVEPIRLRNAEDGKEYVLEFNKTTVEMAEKAGFTLNLITEGKLVSGYSDLFFFAFMKNHRYMKRADTDRILFEELGGMPEAMGARLVELFAEPYNALVESEDKAGKNSKWSVTL